MSTFNVKRLSNSVVCHTIGSTCSDPKANMHINFPRLNYLHVD